MASIGALLDHLVHERAVDGLDDDGIGGLEVRDIEMLSLYVYLLAVAICLIECRIYLGTK